MSTKSSSGGSNALLPIFGLIVLILAGAGAFFLSTPIENLLLDNVSGLPVDGTMQIIVGVVLFVVILMVFGLLYAMIAPKPKTVHEAQLKKEISARRTVEKRQRQARRK